MKKTLAILFFLMAANSAKAAVIVHDNAQFATQVQQIALQYLEYAQQINEVIYTYEQLESIRGIDDLLNFLDSHNIRELREHAPEKYGDILKKIEAVQGGAAAIARLKEDLENADASSYWSRKEIINRMYSRTYEITAQAKAYAAADYETSAQIIKDVNESIEVAATYEHSKQREAAMIRLQGEIIKSVEKNNQSLTLLLALIAERFKKDLVMQQVHMKEVEDMSMLVPE